MKEQAKRKKRTVEIDPPRVPEFEIPDPPVPNRAHTEMVVGSDGRSGLSDNVGEGGEP